MKSVLKSGFYACYRGGCRKSPDKSFGNAEAPCELGFSVGLQPLAPESELTRNSRAFFPTYRHSLIAAHFGHFSGYGEPANSPEFFESFLIFAGIR